MQINTSYNYPKTTFQGRVIMPKETFFTKMIDKLDFMERREIEARLFQEEQAAIPRPQKSLKERIKEFLSLKKSKPQTNGRIKPLDAHWREAVDNITKLITTKLSDEYILKCEKSKDTKNMISFSITRGKEYIYGVGATIGNPKFPEKALEKAVKKINKGETVWG